MKEYSRTIAVSCKYGTISMRLSCWNPWNKIEWKRSFTAYRDSDPFFLEVIIALICIKMEWYLDLRKGDKNDKNSTVRG